MNEVTYIGFEKLQHCCPSISNEIMAICFFSLLMICITICIIAGMKIYSKRDIQIEKDDQILTISMADKGYEQVSYPGGYHWDWKKVKEGVNE